MGKALDTQELWDALGEEGVGYPELERIWLMMWSYNLYLLPAPLCLSGILLLGLKSSSVLSPGFTSSLGSLVTADFSQEFGSCQTYSVSVAGLHTAAVQDCSKNGKIA